LRLRLPPYGISSQGLSEAYRPETFRLRDGAKPSSLKLAVDSPPFKSILSSASMGALSFTFVRASSPPPYTSSKRCVAREKSRDSAATDRPNRALFKSLEIEP